MLDSAKNAATAVNDTVNTVIDRLNNISQEVDNISLSNIGPNISNILNEADKACEYSYLSTEWNVALIFLTFSIQKLFIFFDWYSKKLEHNMAYFGR